MNVPTRQSVLKTLNSFIMAVKTEQPRFFELLSNFVVKYFIFLDCAKQSLKAGFTLIQPSTCPPEVALLPSTPVFHYQLS
jgi:hypothetical protein